MDETEFLDRLRTVWAKYIKEKDFDEKSAKLLYRFHQALYEKNKVMNLTAIRDEAKSINLHYLDSLICMNYFKGNEKRLLDVGCGAGFPSFPLAVFNEEILVTANDSTQKKLDFISETSIKLGLKNLEILPGRAEELAKDARYREKFDIVTARAVANMKVLSELCIPFVRVGGAMIALKGKDAKAELQDAKQQIASMGCVVKSINEFKLEVPGGEDEDRCVIILQKAKPTSPCYPRRYSQIIK